MPDTTATIPELLLNTGARIPQLGFGLWEIDPDGASDAVGHAIEAGFRHIDTASAYENEKGVGEGIAESGVPRDELFVTTKLWNADQGADATRRALDTSLEKLGLEYVDLYLIHWPVPSADRYVETWRTMESLHAAGLAKAIGVSNFNAEHVQRLLKETDIVPAVNQIEVHPLLSQIELRSFNGEHGLLTESWSPLAQGRLSDAPAVQQVADEVGRSTAEVVLRWNLHLGNVVLSRSKNPDRIRSNADLFSFELTSDQIAALSALDEGSRGGPDPDTFSAGLKD